MFLMDLPVCGSIGAVPFFVFLRIRESFLVRLPMLGIELLVKALVIRVI